MRAFSFYLLLVFLNPVMAQETTILAGPWTGGVGTHSAIVKVRLSQPDPQVQLRLWKIGVTGVVPEIEPSPSANSSADFLEWNLTGLNANTAYGYQLHNRRHFRSEAVKFVTFPDSPVSFRIGFASCGDPSHPGQEVFEAIKRELAVNPLLLKTPTYLRPLFFLHMGDLHYRDREYKNPDHPANLNDVNTFRENYAQVFRSPQYQGLFQATPVFYMWDDHDSVGNDAERRSPGWKAARQAYVEMVPHAALPFSTGPICQAFTVGRTRFILTDTRSQRDSDELPDSPEKSVLGPDQKIWFKNELLSASSDPGIRVIFWVNSFPWIGTDAKVDRWSAYPDERREIADFLKSHHITNVCILSGDMHALAADDGTNSDYATGGGAPIPLFQAAALTAPKPSVKGGPYSVAPIPGPGHFGMLEVEDTGGPRMTVRFRGMELERDKLTTPLPDGPLAKEVLRLEKTYGSE